ncbi:ribonuclease P protein subunit p30 [Folsomia candida]|uniref:ribonuclease P protein subunit p30 n=1 Tax=Folsomia candida TaxID=158441 RepID=UPI00160542D5|nr:ribonuclease P protein subunit p30 [Folsomia candida]
MKRFDNLNGQANSKLFDIIAVIPTNHEALQACIISTTLIFDIIAFDFEGPHWINKIRLNRSKGKVAAEKDVQFELSYAPSFNGDEPCENMIYTANRLTEDVCTKKIKNIIIASGASKPAEVRSPKDVVSLGYLLGLDETTTRLCLRNHAHRCVTKGGLT